MNTDEAAELILHDLRRAGEVKRYHTWPTLRQQSVAEHTWQLLRVYTTIFGAPTADVTRYILFHDCGEIAVGDAPYPSKARDADFKKHHDRLEDAALMTAYEFWDLPGSHINPQTYAIAKIKLCEYIEMAEEGLHEYALGSRYGWITAKRCLVKAVEHGSKMAREDWKAAQDYLHIRFELTEELLRFTDSKQVLDFFREYASVKV